MSTMWSDDPSEIRERIRQQVIAAEEHAKAAERFAAMVGSARAQGKDARSEVVVEVDSAGHLMSLHLEERLLDRRVDLVEQAILSAYGAAARAMGEQVAEQTREVFGEDSETSKRLLAAFQTNLENLGR